MTKLFNNQTSETPKCNKLIDIAIQLKESGKGEFSIETGKFGEDFIGIRLGNRMTWHWFELDFKHDYPYFRERYSMYSGQSVKGFNIKYNFLTKIGYYKD
jgi:hypothetical protein